MFTQRRVALRFRSTTFRKRGRVATAKVTFSNKSAPVLYKRNAVLLLFSAVFRPIRSSVNVVLDALVYKEDLSITVKLIPLKKP